MNEIKIQFRYVIPLHIIQFLLGWMPDNRISINIRGTLSRPFIKSCGKGFKLGRDVTLLNSYNLYIGDNVYLAKGCWINAMGKLTLDDEVVFGPYVTISTLQHTFLNNSVAQGGSTAAPVLVGKGTWIAAHAAVKCGVTIASGNLIAANAFVTKDTDENCVYGGVPAKKIGPVKQGGDVFHRRNELS